MVEEGKLDRFMEKTNQLTATVQELLKQKEVLSGRDQDKLDKLADQLSDLKDRVGNLESALAEREKHNEQQKLRELPYNHELKEEFSSIRETVNAVEDELDSKADGEEVAEVKREKIDKKVAYAIIGAVTFILTLARFVAMMIEMGAFK